MKSLFWSGVFQQTQAISQLCAFHSPLSDQFWLRLGIRHPLD